MTLISSNFLPSQLRQQSLLINEFYLTDNMAATLDRYFVLHWTGDHFHQQVTKDDCIVRDDVSYIIVLPTAVRLKFYASHQLKLSFRRPRDFSKNAYVLVRFA